MTFYFYLKLRTLPLKLRTLEHQKETRVRIVAEGGSIKVCSIEKGHNEDFDCFLETSDEDFFKRGLGKE